MFLRMGFDSRLAENLTTRGKLARYPITLDRCSLFAEHPQVQMTGRHGDDMSPCSADVRKAVPPLPWTSQGVLYDTQLIKSSIFKSVSAGCI
jgi:hypothetical protein